MNLFMVKDLRTLISCSSHVKSILIIGALNSNDPVLSGILIMNSVKSFL